MRRNWDLSMMVLIIILAFSSFRSGAFSSPDGMAYEQIDFAGDHYRAVFT